MSGIEQAGKIASTALESMKSQPLAVALVVVNVLFLVGGGYMLHDIANAAQDQTLRKDQLLAELAKDCIVAAPKGAKP